MTKRGTHKKALRGLFSFFFLPILFSIAVASNYFFPAQIQAAQTRAIKVVIKDRDGREVGLYRQSHALLVGVSNYTAGWPDLESVPQEIGRFEAALNRHGFNVTRVMDPSGDELFAAFDIFIDRYGFDRDNRLLLFFSGHGYTRQGGRKGYLVPADAPDPRLDDKGFVRKALSMGQIMAWSRRIESKHALFVFDSCFSGTVFKTKALPEHPPHIANSTALPVRQFISSGSAGEEVPAESVFLPLFIRALGGAGDLDADGYVTGTELGMYLHREVLAYQTGQTPQYGKIRDPELDGGDFVFVAAVKEKSTQLGKPRKSIPEMDLAFWQSIQNSDNPALYEAYIQKFPNGTFVPIAENKIANLKRAITPAAVAPEVSEPEPAPEVAKARLFVEAEPENARVRILNIKPKFYQGIELEPGSYHIEVAARGYAMQKQWIKLSSDEERRMSIELAKIPETGTIHVSGSPNGAKVYIDGNFKGRIPIDLKDMNKGWHRIRVEADGYIKESDYFSLNPRENKTLDIRLKKALGKTVSQRKKKIANSLGMEFVAIPAGSFMMGSKLSPEEVARKYGGRATYYEDEHPRHNVKITRGFYLQATEVTQGQWKAVMGKNPSHFRNCGDDCPVEQVSWNDVQDFIRRLNRKEGTDKYRLPTEAEWEYAARAGSGSAYSFGNNAAQLSDYAWYGGNSGGRTHAVGRKKPNTWGVYDMHGNVWEWCQDWNGKYPSGSVTDPKGPSGGSDRVIRGGSWHNEPGSVRCAYRFRLHPDSRNYDVGFRLLRTK